MLGLGNPGAQYSRTRHNVAWSVLGLLAERWRAGPGESTPRYRTVQATRGEHEVELMEPLTFMNLSGEALQEWRARHSIEPDALLVITDDVYLPLGTLRLRAHGSSGGHRGLESIEQAVGSREYARLRIGVGEAESSASLREHVLEEFAPEELPALDEAIRLAADAVECWVSDGTRTAMNRFNRKARKEVSEP